jgi:hypothetical protein
MIYSILHNEHLFDFVCVEVLSQYVLLMHQLLKRTDRCAVQQWFPVVRRNRRDYYESVCAYMRVRVCVSGLRKRGSMRSQVVYLGEAFQ